MRESVRITAEREVALDDQQTCCKVAEERVMKLEHRLKSLQNACNLRCTNCPETKERLAAQESQLTKLLAERRTALEELFEMKQEALAAAISEKDAHIALLEVSGIKNFKTAEELETLKASRKDIVDKMRVENEKRVEVLQEWAGKNHHSNHTQDSEEQDEAAATDEEEERSSSKTS